MNYLVDTNIVSELLRPAPHPGVVAWANGQGGFLVSAVSVDESVYGLTRKQHQTLLAGYERFLTQRCQVLPVTEAIARHAGALRGEFSRVGITRSQPDMLIAATAKLHGLTLVTRNSRDFDGCGIPVFNPFNAIP